MKEKVISTMLFADLMSSTEMAKNLSLEEYDEMIINFQRTICEVASHHLKQSGYIGKGVDSYWCIAGDELRVFLYSGSVLFDIRNALIIAVKIKLAWLTSEFNEKILKEGRLVSRVGVGINCGKVIKDVREWRLKMGEEEPNIEGYAINVAKRIESSSRNGSIYQIMVGDSLHRKCQESNEIKISFSHPQHIVFKGLGQKIAVYEIVSFINYEILSSMPDSMQDRLLEKMQYAVTQPNAEPWLFITLLRHYISMIASGKHEYIETHAIELAKEALEILEYKPIIYNMLGWLHTYSTKIRNLDTALHNFNKSISIEPGNESALLHKGRILEKMGKTNLSLQAYEEILLYNNSHPEALRKLEENRVIKG